MLPCAADAADADVAKFSPSIVICCCVANAAAPTATFADTAAAIPTGTATNKTTAPKQPATIAAPFKNCFLSLEFLKSPYILGSISSRSKFLSISSS